MSHDGLYEKEHDRISEKQMKSSSNRKRLLNQIKDAHKQLKASRKNTLKEIGERIKRLRIKFGYTQSELSQMCGITRASIANLEAGRQAVQLTTLDILCTVLETTPNYLLGYEENPNE